MLVMLTAAKGSPGVTTTALALTGVAGAVGIMGQPADALLIEVDPAGGDLECWCGPHGDPGLLSVVTEVREAGDASRVRPAGVSVVPGVPAVLAPTSETSMAAALRACSGGLNDAIAQMDGVVVLDRGRWLAAAAGPLDRLARDACLLVVCRPALASIEHTRALLGSLRLGHSRVGLVVVGGTRPYGPTEISAAVGVPVVGVLPWDQRGTTHLVERGVTRNWLRSPLALASQELLRGVAWLADARQVDLAYG